MSKSSPLMPYLDHHELEAVGQTGQDLAAFALVSSNLFLEVLQRPPHIGLEGLPEHLTQQSSFLPVVAGSCAHTSLCQHSSPSHRQRVPKVAVVKLPGAKPACSTTASRPVGLVVGRLRSRLQLLPKLRFFKHVLLATHVDSSSVAKERELARSPAF